MITPGGTMLRTKAVVAMRVLLSVTGCVVVVGLPDRFGDAADESAVQVPVLTYRIAVSVAQYHAPCTTVPAAGLAASVPLYHGVSRSRMLARFWM
jgi:hypothetical protein